MSVSGYAPTRRALAVLGVGITILLLAMTLHPGPMAAPVLDNAGPTVPASVSTVDDPFYPDFDGVIDQFQDLAADYPTIVAYHDIGNATHANRDVAALKISDNVSDEEDEPVWVLTGMIHGSEQLGLRVVLDLAEELAHDYGSDSQITNWVDAYEIWIVGLLNPWGYDHDSSGGSRVTGTRRNGASSIYTETSGVDLARNYDFRWDQGGSTDSTNSRYRGPEPFSETETAAIRDLFREQRPLFGITFHQGNNPDGGQIMWPWEYASGVGYPPDRARIEELADLYADWVYDSRDDGPFCDSGLMDPDGVAGCTNPTTYDHCADLCWEPTITDLNPIGQPSNWYHSAVGTFDYTIEISDRTFNGDFMHDEDGPGADVEDQLYKAIAGEFARNHVDAIKAWFDYFLHNTTEPFDFTGPGLTGHVTDDLLGIPIAATLEVSGYTSSFIEDRTSDAAFGRYWRLLPVGMHNVTVSKPGYDPWSGTVSVGSSALTELDIALTPHLDIHLPDSSYVAWVGDPANPRTFTVRLTLGSAGDPCVGPLPFSIFVRDETGAWAEADVGVQACVQDSYWISVQAPDETEGTFLSDGVYDLKVELDTVSGESAAAVRYTERDEDTVFVMDVSGSMGSGGKLEAAQEAAALLVNELTEDDQGALVWFSGDGVEPNRDADTDYPLGPMTVGNQVALIAAVNGLSSQDLTSIGDGLEEALDESESERADPDHYCGLVLLSDGMENEDNRWIDVESRAQGSPCVIHVVALGPETDELLLQDIHQKGTVDPADDGSYSYATISDTVVSAAGTPAVGVRWSNELAGVYDDIASRLARRQRFYKALATVQRTPREHVIQVDDTIDEAVFALKWSGMANAGQLELRDPNGTVISTTMPDVTYRSGATNVVYRIAKPESGLWRARVSNREPQQDQLPYILLGSGQTFIEFQVYTSADAAPIHQGESVRVLGTLARRGQPITGADVHVAVEAPDGVRSLLWLFDDGNHGDGEANDGFYANVYRRTVVGDRVDPERPEHGGLQVRGSYRWEAVAQTPGFRRMVSGGFAVNPSLDSDQDGMPDPWEMANGLNPKDRADAQGDPDLDGLPNAGEFQTGTDPHDGDTDDGGEGDGSEVSSDRDPLWPHDDTVAPVSNFEVAPLPSGARLTWTEAPSHASYKIWRRRAGGPWTWIGPKLGLAGTVRVSGAYEDSGLENGVTYDYAMTAVGANGQESGTAPQQSVTPVEDPFPPQGQVSINDGAQFTWHRSVTLTFGADQDATEVRLAGQIDEGTEEIGSAWRPLPQSLDWFIPVEIGVGETWTIYVQFRDTAQNVSDVVSATIRYQPPVYLPLVMRSD